MIFRVLNQILEVSKSGKAPKGPNWVLLGHVWTFLVALIDTYEYCLEGYYILRVI